MKNGRIILRATLTNTSPIGIGSGSDEHSDRDIATTLYPIDSEGKILAPERIKEDTEMKELPFIPATSFMGKIASLLTNKDGSFATLWGKTTEKDSNASFIDCSDLLITELPDYTRSNRCNLTEIRDGIRIDSSKGTVADKAKFDYELLGPGAKFDLIMIFRVETGKVVDKQTNQQKEFILSGDQTAMEVASAIKQIISNGFDLGAKSTVGFGHMKGNAELFDLDFEKQSNFHQWIDNKLFNYPIKAIPSKYLLTRNDHFEINAIFQIKNSLIIRSYSKDPQLPDSTHLRSGGNNILSGSSIKGALRGRAERILNTIQSDTKKTKDILAGLFGEVEKEPDGKTVKKDGYTVPSRVFVDEVTVEEVKEETQTRIQIDRFTGGTIDGALIEEVPLFPVKDKDQLKNFVFRVTDAQPLDKGLMLLLLKDLWTGDLPIGGEKSIGRGVLEGKEANLKDGKNIFNFSKVLKDPAQTSQLQVYVDALNHLDNYGYYQKRVLNYKNKKK